MPDPRAKLLVVDDDAVVCRNMAIIFAALGYAIRTAPDGVAALAAIRDEIPDIILSDLKLPVMSGFELLTVLRQRFPSIRVVAMSREFAGTAVPAGVAADAFYEKGSHRPHLLLGAVEAMTHAQNLQATRLSRYSDTPVRTSINGHDPSGERTS